MKNFTGRVMSTKQQKTAIVEVEHFRVHPLYGKRTRRTKRYPVAVLDLGVFEGDIVEFVQTRPISKTKKWIVEAVVRPIRSAERVSEDGKVAKRSLGRKGKK